MPTEGPRARLGRILLERKLVAPRELEALLAEQSGNPERLASRALEKGLADEVPLLEALSEQSGVPAVNLDEVEIDLGVLDLVPAEVAKASLVLGLAVDEESLHVAMADPDDRRVLDELAFVTGKRVFPHVALHAHLVRAISLCYHARDNGEPVWRGEAAAARGEGEVVGAPEPPASGGGGARRASVHARGSGPQRAVGAGSAASAPEPASGLRQTGSFGEFELDPDSDADLELDAPGALARSTFPPAPPPPLHATRDPSPRAKPPPLELSSPFLAPPTASPPPPQPRAPAAAAPAATPAAAEVPPRRVKILVVDDEDEIRMLVVRVLADKGYAVTSASRGLEAVRKIQTETPDLLVLDAMLPEVHGFDICRRIKGSRKYGHIPVIMISAVYRGWRYAQDIKASYGVDEFLEKPFRIADLVRTVEKHARLAVPAAPAPSPELPREAEQEMALGVEAFRNGKLDEAVAHLQKAVGIDPLAARPRYYLGVLLGAKGHGFEAIRHVEAALDLQPDYFPALKNLGVLYEKAGFRNKAIETLERALAHCPDEATRASIKAQLVSLL